MARRGRPPGVDSEQTRHSIVEAARAVFAERGFAATTVASLAEAASLAPSAIYHYFGGKSELYEAVFDATADAIWSDLGSAAQQHGTLLANIEQMVEDARTLRSTRPHHSDFLALVPMEARLHPEFAHLLDRRSKYQDATFGSLGLLGIETGEMRGFTVPEATEIIRSAIMGWFFERHFRSQEIAGSGDALVALFRTLASRD
ncbi:MAG: TetR/AcrR family transcriptional regulator [Actinomycetota bacterium]